MVILLMLMINLSGKKGTTIPSYRQQREFSPREKRPWDFRNFLCLMPLAMFPPLKDLWNLECVMVLCTRVRGCADGEGQSKPEWAPSRKVLL